MCWSAYHSKSAPFIQKDECLGFFQYKKGVPRIVNYNVQLHPKILNIGSTTKADNSEFTGGHGEGLKAGILALRRR